MLTSGRLKDVLSYDPGGGQFRWRKRLAHRVKVGGVAGHTQKDGRISIRIDGVLYLAHRLAWLYMTGMWPSAGEVDHKNRDVGDNRFANLREATRKQNMANTAAHKDNRSGFKGVTYDKSRRLWAASIFQNGRHRHLGRYASPESAAQAYAKAATIVHGAFAGVA